MGRWAESPDAGHRENCLGKWFSLVVGSPFGQWKRKARATIVAAMKIPAVKDGDWFNVYVIFDRKKSVWRAFQLFQRLVREFDRDFFFGQHILSLDCLSDPAAAKQASYDVTHADLIIVAISSEVALTNAFRQWAESWRFEKLPHPRLLLAMLDNPPPSDAADETPFLRSLACAMSLDFLTNRSGKITEGGLDPNTSRRSIVPFLQSTRCHGAEAPTDPATAIAIAGDNVLAHDHPHSRTTGDGGTP